MNEGSFVDSWPYDIFLNANFLVSFGDRSGRGEMQRSEDRSSCVASARHAVRQNTRIMVTH